MKLFYTYAPNKSGGIYDLKTGKVFRALSEVFTVARANGLTDTTWKEGLVTVRLIPEGFTQSDGADPNFGKVRALPAFLLEMDRLSAAGIVAGVLVVLYWLARRFKLLALVALVAGSAGAQTIALPSYIKAVTVWPGSRLVVGVTDTALAEFTAPANLYFRQAQVIANTVEDTASFELQGGTAFATTYATLAITAAGPVYATPTGPNYRKILPGERLRWKATLQDTLYNVSFNVIFTSEP